MKRLLIISLCLFIWLSAVGFAVNPLLITEVHSTPAGGAMSTDEYIELFNAASAELMVSGSILVRTDSAGVTQDIGRLTAWTLGSLVTSNGWVGMPALPSKNFGLILDDQYLTGEQPFRFPSNCVIFRVVSMNPSATSSLVNDLFQTDRLFIYSTSNALLASYGSTFSPAGPGAPISLEMVSMNIGDVSYNYATATNPSGMATYNMSFGVMNYGTPGTFNFDVASIAPSGGVPTLNFRIAVGGFHSLALKSDGTLWATGSNWEGQLGDGRPGNNPTWNQSLTGVSQLAAGFQHSLALKSDGTLWGTGRNIFGQLGDGTTTNRTMWNQVLSGISQIVAGGSHSLALKSDGTLWATGYNYFGQLGNGTNSNRPTWNQVLSGVSQIAAGGSHSLALKSDATLWATGSNYYGQLGDGTTNNRNIWSQVLSSVSQIQGGSSHSLALKSDGTLWATGYNNSGQLGDGTNNSRVTWNQGLSGVSQMAAGGDHSLTLKSDETLWVTGYNGYGQLGDGTFSNRNTWTQSLSINATTPIPEPTWNGTLISGNISGTWTTANNPYLISGNATVPYGLTLNIDPGVTVFLVSGNRLSVMGALIAEGTSMNRVSFTGWGTGPSANIDYWQGIMLQGYTAVVSLNHCYLSFGGADAYGMLDTDMAQTYIINIANSRFSNSAYKGIYVRNYPGTTVNITQSDFEANTDYAIYNNSGVIINARNNWWGDPSGPAVDDESNWGTGATLSVMVDWNPFATAPFTAFAAPTSPPATTTGSLFADTFVSGNWSPSGSPYYISGTVTISEGTSLNIDSGVNVWFEQNARFVVLGKLYALKQNSSPVVFMNASPTSSWAGIEVRGQGEIQLENVLLTGATNSVGIYATDQSGLKLSQSILIHNARGVLIDGGATANIEDNDFTSHHVTAVEIASTGSVKMMGNRFHYNAVAVSLNQSASSMGYNIFPSTNMVFIHYNGSATQVAEFNIFENPPAATDMGGLGVLDWLPYLTLADIHTSQNFATMSNPILIKGGDFNNPVSINGQVSFLANSFYQISGNLQVASGAVVYMGTGWPKMPTALGGTTVEFTNNGPSTLWVDGAFYSYGTSINPNIITVNATGRFDGIVASVNAVVSLNYTFIHTNTPAQIIPNAPMVIGNLYQGNWLSIARPTMNMTLFDQDSSSLKLYLQVATNNAFTPMAMDAVATITVVPSESASQETWMGDPAGMFDYKTGTENMAFPDSVYYWQMWVVDDTALTSSITTGYFGVDTTPPTISLLNVVAVTGNSETTLSVQIEFSDAGSGVDGSAIPFVWIILPDAQMISLNLTAPYGVSSYSPPLTFTGLCTFNSTQSGRAMFNVDGYADLLGHKNTIPYTITFSVEAIIPPAPRVTPNTPIIDGTIYDGVWLTENQPTVSILYHDDDSTVLTEYFQMAQDSAFEQLTLYTVASFNIQPGVDLAGTYRLNEATGNMDYRVGTANIPLADGFYYWRLWLADDSGLASEVVSGSFGVDTTAPHVALSAPAGDFVLSRNSLVIGTVMDNLGLMGYALDLLSEDGTTILLATGNNTAISTALGSIAVNALSNGYYQLILSAKDKAGNEANLTVNNLVVLRQILAPGLAMLGLPFDNSPIDIATTLPDSPALKMARWNPATTTYDFYPTLNQVSNAQGFWVSLNTTLTVNAPSWAQLNTEVAVNLELAPYWNQIANPYYFPVAGSSLFIDYNGTHYTYENAVLDGVIKSGIWLWNNEMQSYELATGFLPWNGYWIKTLQNVTLEFTPVRSTTGAFPKLFRSASANDWRLQIMAEVDGVKDFANYFGLSIAASDGYDPVNDIEEPPAGFGKQVDLYFNRTEWGAQSGKYAVDTQKLDSQKEKTWEFTVAKNFAGSELTLTIPNLNTLPSRYQLTLKNKATGEVVDLRNTDGCYTYPIPSSTGVSPVHALNFELNLVDNRAVNVQSAAALTLTGLKAYPNPFNPAQQSATIEYTLNADASGEIQLFTIQGDRVKTMSLVAGSAGGKNGLNQPTWDGRDDAANPVASGLYFYIVHLRDSAGNEVKQKGRVVVWRN